MRRETGSGITGRDLLPHSGASQTVDNREKWHICHRNESP